VRCLRHAASWLETHERSINTINFVDEIQYKIKFGDGKSPLTPA
jgi:hypothetical protein